MGRTKEYGEKLREATREKILMVAIALFAEKGLVGTSSKDIAKKADVSVGLMYHYYKTKGELFNAIINDGLNEINDLREKLSKQNFEAAIKAFAEEIIDKMQKGLEFSQKIVILTHSTDFGSQLISELVQSTSVEKAQFFVATIQGLCKLQLTLKGEFRIPTVELLTSFLVKSMNHKTRTRNSFNG